MNLSAFETYGNRDEQQGWAKRSPAAHPAPAWIEAGTSRASHKSRPEFLSSMRTSSGSAEPAQILYFLDEPVIAKAERFVETLPEGDLKRNAKEFLFSLRKVFHVVDESGVDMSMLPALEATCPDDHSIVYEWAYDDCRLGFEVESDPTQSYWYVMTTPESGAVRASGDIDCSNFEQWLLWLVILVLLRS